MKVFWFTGLSGSGKTTLGLSLHSKLRNSVLLDGDNLRKGLCSDLGFSIQDRNENIRRVAEVAKLFYSSGMNVICTFISPIKAQREFARNLIGRDFVEIYLSTPLSVCEKRDVKGLYKKARSGELADFTGISSAYEVPENPELVFDTSNAVSPMHILQAHIDHIVDVILEKL